MRSKRILGAVVVVLGVSMVGPAAPQEFRPTLGEIMRVTVLRDGRAVDLQTPWTGQ